MSTTIRTLGGKQVRIDDAVLDELRMAIRGDVLTPTDPGYGDKPVYLVIHFTLVMNQAILGLALLAAKTESVERRFSKTSGGVH